MKRHIFMTSLWALFVTFAVVPVYMSHDWVVYWVVVRSFRKMLRHLHRMYLDLGYRHEIFALEALAIDGLAVTLPFEYIISVIILLVNFPVARNKESLHWTPCTYFSVDFSLLYLTALFISFPYYLSTMVYVCRKREHQISAKKTALRKRRQLKPHLHTESHSEESH